MKWYQYLEDAKKINELWNGVIAIARCENKRIEDYSISDFVKFAKDLGDVMQECDGKESKKQMRLLRDYINKYEMKNPDTSIHKWLKVIQNAE